MCTLDFWVCFFFSKFLSFFCFFFSSRRRHTRWTGDWRSDVCSSDLPTVERNPVRHALGSRGPDGVGAVGPLCAALGGLRAQLRRRRLSYDGLPLGCCRVPVQPPRREKVPGVRQRRRLPVPLKARRRPARRGIELLLSRRRIGGIRARALEQDHRVLGLLPPDRVRVGISDVARVRVRTAP